METENTILFSWLDARLVLWAVRRVSTSIIRTPLYTIGDTGIKFVREMLFGSSRTINVTFLFFLFPLIQTLVLIKRTHVLYNVKCVELSKKKKQKNHHAFVLALFHCIKYVRFS